MSNNKLIEQKRKLAGILYDMLLPISNYIVPQRILKNAKHSYYSFPLYVQSDEKYRNRLLFQLQLFV